MFPSEVNTVITKLPLARDSHDFSPGRASLLSVSIDSKGLAIAECTLYGLSVCSASVGQ